MAIVPFDSSAFVTLVVEEDGNEVVATLWDGCDVAVSTRLAYPEVRATLAAGHLAGRHALRGADAVHLASLLAVGAVETLFAVWNQKLRSGAEAAGARLVPMAYAAARY